MSRQSGAATRGVAWFATLALGCLLLLQGVATSLPALADSVRATSVATVTGTPDKEGTSAEAAAFRMTEERHSGGAPAALLIGLAFLALLRAPGRERFLRQLVDLWPFSERAPPRLA